MGNIVMAIDWTLYKNFREGEFRCKCGCGSALMRPDFMENLQLLRNIVGFQLTINSGYRCPAHNDKVSSTGLTGPHTTGLAVDIGVNRRDAHKVLQTAFSMGFRGIGVKQKGTGRFIHLDMIEVGLRPTVWSY